MKELFRTILPKKQTYKTQFYESIYMYVLCMCVSCRFRKSKFKNKNAFLYILTKELTFSILENKLDVFSKSTGIVVHQCCGVSKGFQKRVYLEIQKDMIIQCCDCWEGSLTLW